MKFNIGDIVRPRPKPGMTQPDLHYVDRRKNYIWKVEWIGIEEKKRCYYCVLVGDKPPEFIDRQASFYGDEISFVGEFLFHESIVPCV